MQMVIYPERKDWQALLARPAIDARLLEQDVRQILDAVKTGGDAALRQYTRKFDGVDLSDMRITDGVMQKAAAQLSPDLKQAIQQAAANITRFHEKQIGQVEMIETMPGITCWRKSVGIEKVGLYIPGGTAPLFSTVLMLAIPAKLAGCREIILCTPPSPAAGEGYIHPAILFAAQVAGVRTVFMAGGVQAIAAMAYGTETIPAVYKIFGPGNQYVTCAKQLVQKDGIAIDMPAGPSELAVYADDTAIPAFAAADLLSQAEHGPDSQVLLVVNRKPVAEAILAEVEKQLQQLPRKAIAARALENSRAILVHHEGEAVDLLNSYAAEHVILSCANSNQMAENIVNAGSVFLGNYSPESAGDYASGTNHTLPTSGHARAYSGVSVDSFVKKITYQQLTAEGLKNIGAAVQQMATAEGLHAHQQAVALRLGNNPAS